MIANWLIKNLTLSFQGQLFLEEITKFEIWKESSADSIYVNDYDDKQLGFNQIHGKN